jgi:hypothetical protein
MDEIRELLLLAHQHDAAAQEARKAAGRLLAALRESVPVDAWPAALHDIGIDLRTAMMLCEMAAGGMVRT